MIKHENNGACQRCDEIFRRYPGFNTFLLEWFRAFQRIHPEAHISCAGRGRDDQEAAFIRGSSRAKYGQSAHNYGCAIDIFEQQGEKANIYESDWFRTCLEPAIKKAPWLRWYGEKPKDKNAMPEFYELPHIELADWRELAKAAKVKLVE